MDIQLGFFKTSCVKIKDIFFSNQEEERSFDTVGLANIMQWATTKIHRFSCMAYPVKQKLKMQILTNKGGHRTLIIMPKHILNNNNKRNNRRDGVYHNGTCH